MSWQPEPADWPTLKRPGDDADEHVRDLLPTYLNGTLDPSEIGRIAVHTERCAGCRAALGSWERIALAVRADASDRDLPPARLLDHVLATIGSPGSLVDSAERPATPSLPELQLPDLPMASREPGEQATGRPPIAPDVIGKSAPVQPSPAARRRPIVSELSSAAVLVLVLVGVVAAFRLAPDDGRLVAPIASPSAVPDSNSIRTLGPDEAVSIDECATEERPSGTAERLVGTTPTTTDVLPSSSTTESGTQPVAAAETFEPLTVLAGLPDADQDQLDGIARTIRQLTACRFDYGPLGNGRGWARENPNGRFFALYSDDFLRRNYRRPAGPASAPSFIGSLQWLTGGPTPGVVLQAGALPDGRIMTLVQGHPSDGFLQLEVFVETEDGWRIDELIYLNGDQLAAEGIPTAPSNRQYLDIGLSTTGATWWTRPSVEAFAAPSGVIVTVANLGEQPQRFEIPALRLSLVIEPGQSAEFEVIAPSGRYELASYAADDIDRDDRRLDIELILNDVQIRSRG